MWLVFALLSGAFYTALGLLQRHMLKQDESDPFAHSFFFSAVSMVVVLPFMLFAPKFTLELFPWGLALLMGALVALQNYLQFFSTKHAPLSVTGTISKLRIIWVFLFGLALAYEIWSPIKGLGILLTVVAGTLIALRPNHRQTEFKGVAAAFGATFMYAAVIIIYTPLFSAFNVVTVTFLLFAVPMVINFLFLKNAVPRIVSMWQKESWRLVVIGALSGFANLALLTALNLGEASRVLVITEAFFIVVLLGEHFVLREKEGALRKGIAATLATIGAVIMRAVS